MKAETLTEAEPELIEAATAPREPRIKVFTPSELRAYNPAQEPVLVGDNHVTRGEVFIIGGEPGVGKSRLAVSLAIAGATGSDLGRVCGQRVERGPLRPAHWDQLYDVLRLVASTTEGEPGGRKRAGGGRGAGEINHRVV